MTVAHWVVTHWSYVLAPFGLTGMYVTGKKKAWGWMLSSFTQLLWLSFAVTTANYGFIPGTLGYLWIYLLNFRSWTSKGKETAMSDRFDELYRELRYVLETSLASSDAEESVTTLDELVKQVRRDDTTILLKLQEEALTEIEKTGGSSFLVRSEALGAAADRINPDKP